MANCIRMPKHSSTPVTPFVYRRHALKLLPPLGAIELGMRRDFAATILRSFVISPATIKARSWAER
ncbi:MAG: hypothetical protein ACTHJ0_05925 [Flavipsychrobacter sp.]